MNKQIWTYIYLNLGIKQFIIYNINNHTTYTKTMTMSESENNHKQNVSLQIDL